MSRPRRLAAAWAEACFGGKIKRLFSLAAP